MFVGYDTGYISSVLVTIGASLGHELSSSEQELVTSLTSGGALIGAVFAGFTADRFGRKLPIWCACAVFIVGTVLQTAAYHVPQFAIGRFVVGLGVGSAAMVCPLYISELAPAKFRGRMIAFNNMSVTFGQLLASALGAGFAQVKGEAWRATVGIGAAPAVLLAILLMFCPESPRQLVAHDHVDEASKVLLRIYPTSTEEQRRAKIASIEMSIHEATQTMVDDSIWKTLARIFTTPSTFRAVGTACIIMAISQLSGFNTLMYYSATLFKIVGFNNATAVAITVSATNFVFSLVNLAIVDKFGRRMILLVTVFGMFVCLLIASVAFLYIPIDTHTLEVQSDEIGKSQSYSPEIQMRISSDFIFRLAWVPFDCHHYPLCRILQLWSSYHRLDRHRADPHGSPRNGHYAEYRDLLVHQHHHRVYISFDDEGNHTIGCFRFLLRHCRARLDLHRFLLP